MTVHERDVSGQRLDRNVLCFGGTSSRWGRRSARGHDSPSRTAVPEALAVFTGPSPFSS